LDLGAQRNPKGVHKAAQGRPWYSKWYPKKNQRNNNQTKGESIKANPASLTWPAQPAQLILASIASPAQPSKPAQHSQHPTAHTPRVGPALGGVALKIIIITLIN